ncbi:coproporphyrinogen III oxidase [uncultured Fusobacterium sp.]|uniref:coproporphyrinogen III oxidase n=2 Tax=Fusobacterium TaxID=848 RepID=UPI002596743C|nr:coproporphyrinogen III oxidase [uncultured Fusobacterium sp.]
MLINSDFEINIRSIEEFARVMVPEALDKTMNLSMKETSDTIEITMEIDGRKGNFIYANQEDKIDEQKQTMVKILLLKVYEKKYSWGGLMGVRPTKVLRRLLSLGYSYKEAEEMLRNFYIVSDEKIELLINTVRKEMEFLNREYINLYIGIPFCPTKCKYCSFASYEISGGVGRYYKGFVETLLKEIEMAGKFLKDEGYKIESIYIGGGTPSTLTEDDLEKVLKKINENIDMSYLKEFTFEAGREDSLTEKKLELVKKYGADRISLNPQTFNENTLKKVNRNFNRENFDRYFRIAKEMNFIINMDLIIGLPDENTEDVLYTLNELEKYDIENLTIHSLAFKRASKLFKEDKNRKELDREIIEKRIKELIEKKQMKPYYMYRQKNIMEWGENVGYAKEGKESVFNIEMIEENQSTMGLGGGAITKIVVEETEFRDYIERIINPKDPALYIKEMKERMESKYKLFKKGEIIDENL